jgi:broad specificity phosphatase PhoE
MKPYAIYLIRHGESEGNVDKTVYQHTPDWKVNLTEKGRLQAKEVATKLYEDIKEHRSLNSNWYTDVKIFSSPLYRARQIAEIINKSLKVDISEDPSLREQEFGNFSKDNIISEIYEERHKFGEFYYKVPNGESGADVYDRMSTFISKMEREIFDYNGNPNIIVIVSHGIAIKTFLMGFFDWTVEDFHKYKTPGNCELIKIALNSELEEFELMTPPKLR